MSSLDNPRDHAVQNMFDRIAGRYDLLNRVISFCLDREWRKTAIHAVLKDGSRLILDLGAGTGDLTFAAARAIQGDGRIVGLDISLPMLKLATAKRERLSNGRGIYFIQGCAMLPPFKASVFDGVMTAFVLRNVSDLALFFADAFRVLKAGGRIVCLDMFPPPKSWFSLLYSIYFYRLVPWLGGLLAHDRRAYEYLSESVQHFIPPETVAALIEQAGFQQVTIRKFLHGAVCMHVAEKPNA